MKYKLCMERWNFFNAPSEMNAPRVYKAHILTLGYNASTDGHLREEV